MHWCILPSEWATICLTLLTIDRKALILGFCLTISHEKMPYNISATDPRAGVPLNLSALMSAPEGAPGGIDKVGGPNRQGDATVAAMPTNPVNSSFTTENGFPK